MKTKMMTTLIAFITMMTLCSASFAEDTGYQTIYAIDVQIDGDVVVRLNDGTSTWYAFKDSDSEHTDHALSILLTAMSLQRKVKLFLDSNGHITTIRIM